MPPTQPPFSQSSPSPDDQVSPLISTPTKLPGVSSAQMPGIPRSRESEMDLTRRQPVAVGEGEKKDQAATLVERMVGTAIDEHNASGEAFVLAQYPQVVPLAQESSPLMATPAQGNTGEQEELKLRFSLRAMNELRERGAAHALVQLLNAAGENQGEATLQIIAEQGITLLEVDRLVFLLADSDQETLRSVAMAPRLSQPASQLTIPIKESSLYREIFNTQQPIPISDLQVDPRTSKRYDSRSKTRSAMIVPLKGNKRILGILYCDCQQKREWAEEDIETGKALAAYSVLLLEQHSERKTPLPPTSSTTAQLRARESNPGMLAMPPGAPLAPPDTLRPGQTNFHNPAAFGPSSSAPPPETAYVVALQESDRLKSELLSTVSHELRTPLSSIKGYATTLLHQYARISAKERHEFLEAIDSASDRLKELIDNLLQMSRLEAGTLPIHCEPLQMAVLIQQVVDEFSAQHRQRTFSLQIPPDLPLVEADHRRIWQVLTNLLENAVKYSQEGNRIAVRVECWETADSLPHRRRGHSVDASDVSIVVQITDHGIGIPNEHLDKIFDRFYRVDNRLTRKISGNGLGLAICRKIIEAHKGDIWAESQWGMGSTFFFSLPTMALLPERIGNNKPLYLDTLGRAYARGELGLASEESWSDSFPGVPELNRQRILLIEDDHDLNRLTSTILELKGYEVVQAMDAIEGLAVARERGCNLILLDLMLPEMSGWEVLNILKREPALRSIPVIIMTAVAGTIEEQRARTLGVADYLVKPFGDTDLVKRVARVLEKKEERKP